MTFNKHCTVLFLVLLTAGIAFGAVAGETVENEPVTVSIVDDGLDVMNIHIEIENFEVQRVEVEGESFDLFTFGMEPTISREGWPDLPFISRTVLVDPQSGINLQINDVDFQVVSQYSPVISPRETGEAGTHMFEHVGEADAYKEHDGFWPPEPVALGAPAILRGFRVINFRFYPLQYNRTTGEMKINNQVDFNLVYEGVGQNIVVEPGRVPPSEWVYRVLDNLVENPPERPARDDLQSGSYLYIVPNAGVDDILEPLIEWRRRQGHRVIVEHVANGAGSNVIHDVIEEAYESNDPVEYVALVGDVSGSVRLSSSNATGDYDYTTVDGNDALPDIALGRISVTTTNELQRVVNKLEPYESDPYMDDTDWYLQGGVVAGHIGNGLSTVLVAKYVKSELLNLGFTEVRGWYHNVNGEIGGQQDFLSGTINWGVSVFHYRAYSSMNQLPINVIHNLRNDDGRWPAVLAISCNTGNFVPGESYTEAFLRASGGGGGIGAIGTATSGTNVKFNNIMAGGVWTGIYKAKLYAFGWGFNFGKYELWRAYNGFDGGYMNYMHWNNLMGDPGTHIWTGIPREIEVDFDDHIFIGQSRVTVEVWDSDDEVALPGALVCLYKDDDDIHMTKYTDDEGIAEFRLDPDDMSEGDLLVTVTKHNVKPYLGEISVEEGDLFLGVGEWTIDDDEEGQSHGDGDGDANAGEIIELEVEIFNYGDEVPEGEVRLTMESLSPWAEANGDVVVIEEAPDAGESTQAIFIVEIDPACPDEETILLPVTATADNTTWQSMISIESEAPRMAFDGVDFNFNNFDPGEIVTFRVEVKNIGHKLLGASSARMWCPDNILTVVQGESSYPSIGINAVRTNSGERFRIHSHPFAVPGMSVPLFMELVTDEGFRDTVEFSVRIGESGEGDPFGPDAYGYVCFDSGDEGWELTPQYDWIEINDDVQGFDFRGTELNLSDGGDNQDRSVAVDLPFNFKYYGELFDEITVCSNGWAAFGDQHELADFRNRHIGQALGPNAQLCVWWDNLIVVNESAILTHYDDDDHRFIIEWSNVQRLVEGGGGSRETFEIILYDPEEYPTDTGDGIIVFQYKEVSNDRANARNDTPYCTIGISNPTGMDGIEYTYWNTYHPGAKVIEDEMAIKWITSSAFITGVVEGTVTDLESGESISNAEITTTRGFRAETDEEGFYRINDILIGEGYQVTVRALGWNDSTSSDFEIAEDETVTVDFELLHPEFTPSEQGWETSLMVDESEEHEFILLNSGNGPLEWRSERTLRGEANAEPWELRHTYNAAVELEDPRLEGVVFANDHFYINGAAGDSTNCIYVLDREWNVVDTIEQFGDARWGMKDLAWDGELIWGSGEVRVFGFTPEGELRREWEGPYNPNTGIAWDPERETLWVANTARDIIGHDRDGNPGRELDRHNIRIYSLSCWPDDPDGYDLYISSFGDYEDEDGFEHEDVQILYKMNPDNSDTMFVGIFEPEGVGRPTGGFITNEYDIYSWVLMSLCNVTGGNGDRLNIWQVDVRKDWMRLVPSEGELQTGEREDLTLTIDATGLPAGVTFEGDMVFHHNAANGHTDLPITLHILAGPGMPGEQTLNFNPGWNLVSLNIDPDEEDVTVLTNPLVEAGQLVMMKDGRGRFFRPDTEFNNIPRWETADGYQMYVTEGAQLLVAGRIFAPERPIPLSSGWNMKAYYPRDQIDAAVALSNIEDQLIIAKNNSGRFYMPEYGFNNLGNMRPGQGYQIKVEEDIDLVYNQPEQAAFVRNLPAEPEYYSTSAIGADNMSALVLADQDFAGWEIGVHSESGELVGSGRFDDEGRCGLALWGGINSPDAGSAGLTQSQPLSFRLWNGVEEQEAVIEPISGEPVWSADGIFVGRLLGEGALPVEFGITGAFPNPFNHAVRIRFGLAEAGPMELRVFDITGREVATLISENRMTGYHSITWNADRLPSGLYFSRLEQADQVSTIKMMLIK